MLLSQNASPRDPDGFKSSSAEAARRDRTASPPQRRNSCPPQLHTHGTHPALFGEREVGAFFRCSSSRPRISSEYSDNSVASAYPSFGCAVKKWAFDYSTATAKQIDLPRASSERAGWRPFQRILEGTSDACPTSTMVRHLYDGRRPLCCWQHSGPERCI